MFSTDTHERSTQKKQTHNRIQRTHTLSSHEIWKKILLNIQFTYIECFIIAAPRIQICCTKTCILWLFCSNKGNSGMWSSLCETRCCFRLGRFWISCGNGFCRPCTTHTHATSSFVHLKIFQMVFFFTSLLLSWLLFVAGDKTHWFDGMLQIKNRKLKRRGAKWIRTLLTCMMALHINCTALKYNGRNTEAFAQQNDCSISLSVSSPCLEIYAK